MVVGSDLDMAAFLRVPRSAWRNDQDRRSFSSAMSTDTDGEDFASSVAAPAVDDLAADDSSAAPLATLLITANVGSVFEDSGSLGANWQREVVRLIADKRPQFVAIHFQEVGGKNVHESMLAKVNQFVESFLNLARELDFTRHVAFFDQNFRRTEKFTALGSLYLIHESVDQSAEIYDFQFGVFRPLSASHREIGDLESVSLMEKRKFPLSYFPERRWSRKGYLRTRWRIRGTTFDLVNIHLFHDANNLVSVEAAPSVYSVYRRRALQFTLDCLQGEGATHPPQPFFIFGDFNFRLEGRDVVRKLAGAGTETMTGASAAEALREFRDDSDRVVLALGKKQFTGLRQTTEETFGNGWPSWTQFDQEASSVVDRLSERKLSFPPTYPFEEDPELGGRKYMGTRCPAWCDRILFSHETRQIMSDEDNRTGCCDYDIVGMDVCMGDHKPVYLSVGIRAHAHATGVPARAQLFPRFHPDEEQQEDLNGRTKKHQHQQPVVSESDLLTRGRDDDNSMAAHPVKSTLIIYKGDKSVKVYKETTV